MRVKPYILAGLVALSGNQAVAAEVSPSFKRQYSPSAGSFAFDTSGVRFYQFGNNGNNSNPITFVPPENITVEATFMDGALVDFPIPEATGGVGVIDPIICTPESGSVFPLGETIVTCNAFDEIGQSAETSFLVAVVDTTPPETDVLETIDGFNISVVNNGETLSDSITINFDAVDLVAVSYFECSLNDAPFEDCDSPVSYSDLPQGTYQFLVRAADTSGNIDATPAQFVWDVVTADQALETVTDIISDLIAIAPSNQAGKKLENALRKVEEAIVAAQSQPVQYSEVTRKVEQAVKQIEDAIGFGLSSSDAEAALRQLAIVSKAMAEQNIEETLAQGGNQVKINDAIAFLNSGNSAFDNGDYAVAIEFYSQASREADKA